MKRTVYLPVAACALGVALAACSADSQPSSSSRGPSPGNAGAGSVSSQPGDSTGTDGDDGFGNTTAEAPMLEPMDGVPIDPDEVQPDEEGDCGGIEVEPMINMEVIPGNILVIFDKSGSMDDDWGQQQKWQAAASALIAALTPLQDNITVGSIFYPQTGGCEVAAIDSGLQIDFQPGAQFIASWNTFMGQNRPSGLTPLGTAMQVADMALQTRAATLPGTTVVVVLTDGEPNCSTDEDMVGQLPAAWLALGVETHVVGLPGSNGAVQVLDAMASAGGTIQHIVPDDPQVLQDKLAQIVSSTVTTNFDSCRIGLPEKPVNLDDVNLTVVQNGVQQAVARDLGTGGGWTIDPEGTEIVLQGLFCDLAQEGEYDKIGVVYGCVELPPLPPPRPE